MSILTVTTAKIGTKIGGGGLRGCGGKHLARSHLLHEVANRLLQVVDPCAHVINAGDNRIRHLCESSLLRNVDEEGKGGQTEDGGKKS